MINQQRSKKRTKLYLKIFLGPFFFAIMLLIPFIDYSARGALGLLFWMATWWIMRPVHMGVTAFLPLPVLAIFNFVPVDMILSSYANIIVILLLGANMITVAWSRWDVDKRIALLALLKVGQSVKRQVMIWFFLSVVMSVFLPNTIVAATLVPIAIAMLKYLGITGDSVGKSEFATGVLLAIAWGTSVGGFGSPLGGAMNLVTMKFVEEMITGREFMFWVWVSRMFPLVIITSIPVLLYLLYFPYEFNKIENTLGFFKKCYGELGPFSREEKWGLVLFVGAALLSFLRPLYVSVFPFLHPAYIFLTAGILTFIIPVGNNDFLSTWEYTKPRMLWGLFYLFAGGIALGRTIELSGAGTLIAELVSPFAMWGHLFALFMFSLAAIILTNISSNTATVAIIAPLVIATMQGLNINPLPFLYVATAAANAGYVLPSSSGGPALAAGYGVNIGTMAKRGLLVLSLTLISLVVFGYLLMIFWEGFWQA